MVNENLRNSNGPKAHRTSVGQLILSCNNIPKLLLIYTNNKTNGYLESTKYQL